MDTVLITLLKSKLHKATVTDVAMDYEGSLTVDPELLNAVNIRPFEKILVANLANGARFETYAIPATPGSREVCLNGAAAHKGKVGDRLIVFAFAAMTPEEAVAHRPLILVLNENNRPAGDVKRG